MAGASSGKPPYPLCMPAHKKSICKTTVFAHINLTLIQKPHRLPPLLIAVVRPIVVVVPEQIDSSQFTIMAWIRAWFFVLLAMALFFGDGAHATRSLQQVAPAPAPVAPRCPSPTTANVTLESYAGVWYEIGSTALIKSRTESDLVCITARYSVISSTGAVRVRNEGYNTSAGEFATIVGSAAVVGTGRLGVSFFPGAPPADYRIIYLTGAAEEMYETAVVYSCEEEQNGFQSLYILSRTPKLDDDESVEKLLAFVAGQGIVLEPSNQLVLTPQDSITCGRNYED